MSFSPETTANMERVVDATTRDKEQRHRLNIAEKGLAIFCNGIRQSRQLIFASRNPSPGGIEGDFAVELLLQEQRDLVREEALALVQHEGRFSDLQEELRLLRGGITRGNSYSSTSSGTVQLRTFNNSTDSLSQADPEPNCIWSGKQSDSSTNFAKPNELSSLLFTHWNQRSPRGSYKPEITVVEAIKIFRNRYCSRHLATTSIPLGWFRLSEILFAKTFIETRNHIELVSEESWIMDKKWLKVALEGSALSHAELAFSSNNYQAGMIATDVAVLSAPTIAIEPSHDNLPSPLQQRLPNQHSVTTIAQTINLHLIRSCAFLACGEFDRALESADKAFSIAKGELIYYMMSKSQLYRGLSLMKLTRWKEASDAFTRAANVRGWASKVANLKCLAEKNLLEEMGRRRRLTGR